MAYSFAGKTWLLADLLILTCLFLLRIALGGATTNIPISPWFLSFAAALFLSLAALKRWIECREIPSLPHPAPPMRRSYRQQHAPFVLALGLTSALASVSILAAYIYSPTAQSLYAQPQILFGLPLILALWLARAWTLAARGSIHDDPLVHAVKDPWSYYLFLPALILFWAARPAVLPP
jgi:4-hydroxybenzoate polyprenyltransferase